MPIWLPAAYMNAPENMVMHRMFCRVCMSLFS